MIPIAFPRSIFFTCFYNVKRSKIAIFKSISHYITDKVPGTIQKMDGALFQVTTKFAILNNLSILDKTGKLAKILHFHFEKEA